MSSYAYKFRRNDSTIQLQLAQEWFALQMHDRTSLLANRTWNQLSNSAQLFLLRNAELHSAALHAGEHIFRGTSEGDVFNAAQTTLSSEEILCAVGPVLIHQDGKEPVLPTGNLIVRFATGTPPKQRIDLLEGRGLTVKLRGRSLPCGQNRFLAAVPNDQILKVFDAASNLYSSALVEESYPELVMRRDFRATWPKVWPHQWNFASVVQGITGDIHVQEAWQTSTGKGITIAVLDVGFDLRHPEFQAFPGVSSKILKPVAIDASGTTQSPDNSAFWPHGNGVAGLACADGIGNFNRYTSGMQGVSGVAPGAAFMPIVMTGRLEGGQGCLVESFAFEWAMQKGADVICCAWGPPDDNGRMQTIPLHLSEMITQAATKGRNGLGCVIVFAAGNDHDGVDKDGWASHPNVIAAGACDATGRRSVSSEFGNALWCLAPGQDAYVDGARFDIESTGLTEYSSLLQPFDGTSAAASQVAGVAALMLSANGNLTSRQVKQLIAETCEKTPHLPGEGPYDAGTRRSLQQGFGRIHAAAAVQAAQIGARN